MKFVTIEGVDYEVLPFGQWLLQRLSNPLKNYVIPKKMLLNFIQNGNSPLVRESIRRPGSWQAMEICYENADPVSNVDKMSVRYGPFAMALRNRRKMMVKILSELIRKHSTNGGVNVVGVGSGPGTNVLDAMDEAGVESSQAYCIDIDDNAFDFGRVHAEAHNFQNRIQFIQGDARDIGKHVNVTPTIVKMVGILEYLTDDQVLELFRTMYEALSPGGNIVTHSIQDAHGMAPFLRRAFEWHLNFRTPDDVVRLLGQAGFSDFMVKQEPMNIYGVVVGSRPV